MAIDRHDGAYTAFEGHRRLASGPAALVATAAAGAQARGAAKVIVFDDQSGRQVDLDPRSPEASTAQATPPDQPPAAVRGRPKLGVVAREVTLLPRHWDWLATQPGGASAALRRLVEDARRLHAGADRAREAQQALYNVLSALAGDLPRFEDAARALFAADDPAFEAIVGAWPQDVSDYLLRLAVVERQARIAQAGD
jgi:hypothetical protein